MKITFVNPPYKDMHMVTPPIGLGYMIAVLEKNNHQCFLIDAIKDQLTIEQTVEKIKATKADLVAINIMTAYYYNVQKVIELLKKDNIKVVIGGAHVSALPIYSLKETKADYGVNGEGEYAMLELVNKLENNEDVSKIKNLIYWDEKEVKQNPRRPLIKYLDELPMPAWDKMNPQCYPKAPQGTVYKEFPVAQVLTSRGCPYQCSYCSSNNVWGVTFRTRSAKNIVDEIEFLVKTYGVKEIQFIDDNMTMIRERAVQICNEILKRKLKIHWSCPNGVRIDSLDEELVKKMKLSGCYSLCLGIESGSQEILNSIHKRLNLKIIPGKIKLLKKYGIKTAGFFILGFPNETKETIQKTIDFALSLPLDRAGFFVFTEMPGSQIFKENVKNGVIDLDNIDWSAMDYFKHSTYRKLEGLSDKELTKFYSQAQFKFYARPRIMWGLMKDIKFAQLGWLMKRVLHYSK
ncbi:MAG: radical SAM protein [archaeon]